VRERLLQVAVTALSALNSPASGAHINSVYAASGTKGLLTLTNLYDTRMKKPPRDPDVADLAPTDSVLTVYDEEHIITYLRMLDADKEGADWREVTQIVLHINPELEPDRARRAFDSHLTRAKWMTEHGYRHLLRGGASNPNL